MNTKTWVCSKWNQNPTNEEKREVIDENQYEYIVRAKHAEVLCRQHFVPKSDYRVCEPPERWVNVTSECAFEHDNECWLIHGDAPVIKPNGYRLRKVKLWTGEDPSGLAVAQWAFIVEKREEW